MQIISTIGLITINETVIIELISFLIFLFIINRLMFRPLQKVMRERESHIGGMTGSIETFKTRLKEMDDTVRAQELAAIKEANQHKANLEDAGSEEAKRIMDGARQEISTLKQESQQFINSQISKAREEIKKEAETLAIVIMEKVLDRRLTR